MRLSKKQKVSILISVLLIIFFLGLDAIETLGMPICDFYLTLYGIYLWQGKTMVPLHRILYLVVNRKYLLIVFTLIFGLNAVITSKKK